MLEHFHVCLQMRLMAQINFAQILGRLMLSPHQTVIQCFEQRIALIRLESNICDKARPFERVLAGATNSKSQGNFI